MSSAAATPAAAAASPAARPLLMIPGPVEFDPLVLAKLGEATPGHVSAGFLEEFGSALCSLRDVLRSGGGSQPFVLAGSGTLGWELVAANLLEVRAHLPGPGSPHPAPSLQPADVLIANTGYFSDSWKDCFEAFGLSVASVAAPEIGGTVTPEALSAALLANPSVRLVALTQVDTSTGVLNDIASLAAAAKQARPDVLVAVDGVCSFGAEEFRMEDWGVDAALTCSQKALGVPPGLCVLMLSPSALKVLADRQSRVPTYYGDLRRWMPVMRSYESRTPSYFATPPVNLIRALKVSLDQILAAPGGMEARWARHSQVSRAFKAAVDALGLKQVPTSPTHAANTLSAVYFPEGAGVTASTILSHMVSSGGVVCAGGLHKDIKARYFRVGHMAYSVMGEDRNDVLKVVQALENALDAAGVTPSRNGEGTKAFKAVMQQ